MSLVSWTLRIRLGADACCTRGSHHLLTIKLAFGILYDDAHQVLPRHQRRGIAPRSFVRLDVARETHASLTLPCRQDTAHMSTLATKLRDLNKKIDGIRREQQYQREIEATFRDASERVNKRALWWSLCQMVVLVGAGAWQMRHLKVSFREGDG